MPEIASVTPAVPVAPAPPGGPASATPTAPADFLGQLAAALKTLKSLAVAVVALPDAPTEASTALTTAPSQDEPTRTKDTESEQMPEILAALGFLPVPIALSPVEAVTTQTSPSTSLASTVPPATLFQTMEAQGSQEQPVPQDPPLAPPPDPMAALPPRVAASLEATLPSTVPSPPPIPSTTTTPTHMPPAGIAAQTLRVAELGQPPTPGTVAPPVAEAASSGDAAFQANTGSDNTGSHNPRGEPASTNLFPSVGELQPAPSRGASTMDQAAQVVGASLPSIPTPPLATDVKPSDVVAQIAHQADLYRLPGNRGVRIQLHPEELGGVQVTVRFATSGNLELHISVEHAATGALVQSGWNQLRDALVTQGFSPERLVMSVTGPGGAGAQMGFSSSSNGNGGAYRSDAGLMASMQNGQFGQSRDNAADQPRVVGRWTSTDDATGDSAVSREIATATSAASRIDYRV